MFEASTRWGMLALGVFAGMFVGYPQRVQLEQELAQCRTEAVETTRAEVTKGRVLLDVMTTQAEVELADTGRRLERLKAQKALVESIVVDGGVDGCWSR